MPTYRISTWETEYKRAFIDADSPEDAERIAQESLEGERADIDWDVFDRDLGRIELIEEV
jgi:hypothetical protein